MEGYRDNYLWSYWDNYATEHRHIYSTTYKSNRWSLIIDNANKKILREGLSFTYWNVQEQQSMLHPSTHSNKDRKTPATIKMGTKCPHQTFVSMRGNSFQQTYHCMRCEFVPETTIAVYWVKNSSANRKKILKTILPFSLHLKPLS